MHVSKGPVVGGETEAVVSAQMSREEDGSGQSRP